MEANENAVLGYFRWEGDPCRVIAQDTAYAPQAAQIYVAGEGFKDISMSDLMRFGVEIGQAEFKELVLEAIALARTP